MEVVAICDHAVEGNSSASFPSLSVRAKREPDLKPQIERVFAADFEVYGERKVWRQMPREGFGVARCTVARLMVDFCLHGVIRGEPVRVNNSGHGGSVQA